jgi:hypothetical protein
VFSSYKRLGAAPYIFCHEEGARRVAFRDQEAKGVVMDCVIAQFECTMRHAPVIFR